MDCTVLSPRDWRLLSGTFEPLSDLETLTDYLRLRLQKRLKSLVKKAQQETLTLLEGEYVPQPARRRLRLPLLATPKAQRPCCGARCRDGHLCRVKVVDGCSRCRLHGGARHPGPKTDAGREAIAEANRRRKNGPRNVR